MLSFYPPLITPFEGSQQPTSDPSVNAPLTKGAKWEPGVTSAVQGRCTRD